MENGEYPDSNFNTFLDAFASVFIVLANDGWTVIFFSHYRACGSLSSTLFFLTLLILGQFVILNLFLAILLQNFDETSIDEEYEKAQEKKRLLKLKLGEPI